MMYLLPVLPCSPVQRCCTNMGQKRLLAARWPVDRPDFKILFMEIVHNMHKVTCSVAQYTMFRQLSTIGNKCTASIIGDLMSYPHYPQGRKHVLWIKCVYIGCIKWICNAQSAYPMQFVIYKNTLSCQYKSIILTKYRIRCRIL